jgi:hypothetical protein
LRMMSSIPIISGYTPRLLRPHMQDNISEVYRDRRCAYASIAEGVQL